MTKISIPVMRTLWAQHHAPSHTCRCFHCTSDSLAAVLTQVTPYLTERDSSRWPWAECCVYLALLQTGRSYRFGPGNGLDLCHWSETCTTSTLSLYVPKQMHVSPGAQQEAVYGIYAFFQKKHSTNLWRWQQFPELEMFSYVMLMNITKHS